MFFTKLAFILLLCNKLSQVDKSILPHILACAVGIEGCRLTAGNIFIYLLTRTLGHVLYLQANNAL
jgi:hypothetical protein